HMSALAPRFPPAPGVLQGDFILGSTRLYFDNLSAESGGAPLRLAGSVNYAEKPLRYDINVRSDRVRIRYPEGMSWLAGGTLRLTGTPAAAVLSGRVTIERVKIGRASCRDRASR